MSSKGNPFFKIEDLQSLELTIEGSNATSQVKILKGAIQLTEIFPDGIGIEVPPRSCALGHTLSLQIHGRKLTGTIRVRQPDGTIVEEKEYLESNMQMTGTVEKIEGDPKQRFHVQLRFRQYAKDQWQALLTYFSTKQGSVNRLIKKTRR